ncbi:unnamed protein product [Ranitomeya imitator]|uniref:Sulfotransferase n=1 Tax=Ranitomeya imitator TaxID=111125 RepID=A0ABN9L349_9NEOB|nr:unnamed protein product [Ranitomeya imitator]
MMTKSTLRAAGPRKDAVAQIQHWNIDKEQGRQTQVELNSKAANELTKTPEGGSPETAIPLVTTEVNSATEFTTAPPSGTTWMQEIVDLIMLNGDVEKSMRAPCFIKVPFIELNVDPGMSGVNAANAMESPRLLKTHLPIQLLPPSFWEKNAKVIYVARNAKDCMVSYFHFHRLNKGLPDPGTWNEFYSTFLSGKVALGAVGLTTSSDGEGKRPATRFSTSYTMTQNEKSTKIAKFSGQRADCGGYWRPRFCSHHILLSHGRKTPNGPNFSALPSLYILDQSISPFMRKGKVGDWKNHFSVSPE